MRISRPWRRGVYRPFGGLNPNRRSASDKTRIRIEQMIRESDSALPAPAVETETIHHDFRDFALPQALQSAIAQVGYTKPTPIQDKVIPVALDGNDIIGVANTGTGKTAAFLLPLITRVMSHNLRSVLILAPTRELAIQIQEDFVALSKHTGLRSVLCIGGTPVRRQLSLLRTRYQFLIGTPGRVKDMYSQQAIPLATFDALVLDEVDRMLDMGFIKDVRELVNLIPRTRQSLFFSATMPYEVEQLCQQFSKQAIRITAKPLTRTNPIEQRLVKLQPGQQKLSVLHELLSKTEEYKKVIIFGRTKHGVKRLALELYKRGFRVDSIHGNKTQAARQKSLELFKAERVSILVATDVAARGIDITNVSHVINYDIPQTVEDYIHRIGRTARAGKGGVALTLVD